MNARTLIKLFLLNLALVALASCTHTPPVTERTMDFEQGIRVMAANLADQLEKSSVGNMLNKVVINSLTKQKQLKKIVVDPFIDVESGYPVKANTRIVNLVSAEIMKRFQITGEMEPANLNVSEYVLNGMVSIDNTSETTKGRYKIRATVFEKSTGQILAAATVFVARFDTTPLDIYKDSPVYLKGKSYDQFVSSVRQPPTGSTSKGYQDRLQVKAMLVKGDKLYEQKEFKQSLSYYNQVAERTDGQAMETYSGQFTNLAKQGQFDEAEVVYAKLAQASISETQEISNKITFTPNAKVPPDEKLKLYTIYVRQIAKLVASVSSCRVKIVGHCSKTGSASYNDKLSLQRAQWIQKQMITYAPEVKDRLEPIGRGFRDNLVGTGADNITDEVDRRISFAFNSCNE